MLQGRPLYDNDADAALYVAPPAWTPVRRAVERQLNVVVVGGRGVGKTSLLRQLQHALRDSANAAFVDGTAVDGAVTLAARVRDVLVGRPGITRSGALTAPLAAITGDPDPPSAGASRLYYETLQSLSTAPPATILLDASASAAAVHGIFGRMRDTIWQLPHTWVVAIDEDDRATALRPPADAFFDTVVALEPLSTESLTQLLDRRASDVPQTMIERVAALADGNPRAALRALGNADVNERDPGEIFATHAKLLDAASALGRPHGMLMAELLERGQAGPSDEALQRALGLTRARLTTLLHALSEHRLVVLDVERPDGPGRPRTVYRPALDA